MRHSLLAFGLPVLALGTATWAQTNLERFERQLEQIRRETRLQVNPAVPVGQRALLDYGGYVTLNFFAIDDIEQRTHVLQQYDLVGYARLNIDDVHEFFFRARTSYRHFSEGGNFDPDEGDDETIWPTVEQAFYRFDLAKYLGAYEGKNVENNVHVQAGRQFVYWANGLVLAETLDGGLVDISVGNSSLMLLGGVTGGRNVDFDSSRPDFDHETSRGFYGGMLSTQVGKHRPFIYGLVQRDYNDDEARVDVFDDTRVVTEYEYNSYYLGAGVNGSIGDRLAYGVEFAYEGGDSLSSSLDAFNNLVPQREEDIEAYALDVRLDYLLADPHRTRLSAEGIFASGDDDRLTTTNTFRGNRAGTNDTAFNAFGLLNTGLAFAPPVSNLVTLRLGASTFPILSSMTFRQFQVGTDVLFFMKYNQDGPIDEPTTDDRFLGFEPDIYVNWQIASDITLAMRYGVFFPGSAIVEDDNPRNFFFMGVTFAF